MRLRFEGTREWNWALRGLSEREHLAAAEFARQNNILDRMVSTSERTRIQVDYTQRFPAPHNDIMRSTTQTLGLDQAWVYGLIRQESRFIMDAQSSVGASGLMQVMPSTGRWVAKKIGLTDFVQDMLSDVHTNILLGASYMNIVLGEHGRLAKCWPRPPTTPGPDGCAPGAPTLTQADGKRHLHRDRSPTSKPAPTCAT